MVVRLARWQEQNHDAFRACGLAIGTSTLASAAAVGIEVDPQRYQIPDWSDVNVDPGGRYFVRFTLAHTGFKLPKEGGTLFLVNATGEEIDRVEYPAQLTDVSYARFSDGNRAWIYNSIPDLGESNKDNGPLPPRGSAKNVDLPTFGPGRPIRFNVFGEDDGIIRPCL